jgi:D-alanyl-D-alanine carboxypeptidase (penicillin-binding protein 5/6)
MTMYLFRPFLLCLLMLCSALSAAVEAPPVPRGPEVAARAWLLMDHDSGQVLAARNAELPVPPASLTKLAVAYVLFQHLREGSLKLSDTVTVSGRAAETKGASMFLRPNESIGVEELIKGMLVVSANDATVALAEHVAGSESAFVTQMNTTVRGLGLMHTTFVTTNGLPATGHVSTAHDLARLAGALLRDFPEHYAWFSVKDFTHSGIRQYNRNALLWRDASVDGMKTGQTREAGFCLIGSAKRGGMRLIAVVLGAADENGRVIAAQQLLDYGFRNFETRLLYAARTPITEVRVWMGDHSALPLGPSNDLYLTLPRGWHERARVRLTVQHDQTAPVQTNQPIGLLAVDLDRDAIAEYPLVALSDVARGNVFQRAADHLRRLFQ